jgi:hypothetical protein
MVPKAALEPTIVPHITRSSGHFDARLRNLKTIELAGLLVVRPELSHARATDDVDVVLDVVSQQR